MAFFITFGTNHIEPTTGQSLYKRYVVVPIDDEHNARTAVHHRIGARWAMIYHMDRLPHMVDRYELVEWEWEWK